MGGLDIPLAGRIVAVADVWDALTSDRAYRPAWDPDRAVSHIAAASGTLFDPACVEAFLDVVAETGLAPERTAADLEELITGCHPGRATSGGDTGASPRELARQTASSKRRYATRFDGSHRHVPSKSRFGSGHAVPIWV